jgi:RNA polymerase sigma-70 factor (ECF subfamily)
MNNDDYDKKVIRRAKEDPQFFSEIFDKYYDLILKYVVHRTGNVEVSKDITAETFYKALNKLHTYQPTFAPFSAWLYRIATNEINYFFRRKKYEPISLEEAMKEINLQIPSSIDVEKELVQAQETIDNNKKYQMAKEALFKLPVKYQEVLVLKYIEGIKVTEISKILDKSEGTVKSLIFRGIDKLRKKLNK